MKHAIFAERVAPLLADAEATANRSIAGLPAQAFAEAGLAKVKAVSAMKQYRSILYPEDESDGDR